MSNPGPFWPSCFQYTINYYLYFINVFRMSGLHQAALMGNTEIMELLLEHGALVSTRDNKGEIIKLK